MAEVVKRLWNHSPIFGCDPELFFERDGQVVGAEKVLPADGRLAASSLTGRGTQHKDAVNKKAFVLDGVQVELNPNPHGCRANFGSELSIAFRALKAHLAKMDSIKVSFTSVVTIDPKELESLNERARQFGCEPSFNGYDKDAKIVCNPATYMKRSAGGHIHIGLKGSSSAMSPAHPKIFAARERLWPIMDALLGNTCIMIDRDPEAAERRKNYGRAGEYRLPDHGFEYRTLSNFWLRSYQLMSFVMGMSRMATSVLGTTLMGGENGWDAERDLLDRVDLPSIQKAINTNDLELAKKNWEPVRAFILERVTARLDDGCGLEASLIKPFDYFVDKTIEKGLDYWFPQDPLTHWTTLANGHGIGFESFLHFDVTREMLGTPPTPHDTIVVPARKPAATKVTTKQIDVNFAPGFAPGTPGFTAGYIIK